MRARIGKLLLCSAAIGWLGLSTGGCKLECTDDSKAERVIEKIGDTAKDVTREVKRKD